MKPRATSAVKGAGERSVSVPGADTAPDGHAKHQCFGEPQRDAADSLPFDWRLTDQLIHAAGLDFMHCPPEFLVQ